MAEVQVSEINQNSIEVSQNAKGERSCCVKVYYGNSDSDEAGAKSKIQRLLNWFVTIIKA